MKLVHQLAPLILILGSCAPKAVLVEEAGQPTKPAASQSKPDSTTNPDQLPDFKPNDGLLDPAGLTRMPTENDMKSTAEDTSTTVIANPPESDKPSDE